ncbi:hypothetical protein BH23BAC1_BH23BAC1_12120 [soil metagenome]
MKKSLFLFVLIAGFAFGFSSKSHAQNDGKKNIVKINPLSLALATGNFSYERLLGEKTSFQMGTLYTSIKWSGNGYAGLGLTPEFRYYFSAQGAGSGFYIAPYARYWNLNASVKSDLSDINEKFTTSMLSGGLNAGGQLKVGNSVRIDLFFGPQYFNVMSTKYESNSNGQNTTAKSGFLGGGMWVRGGVNVGVAF